MARLWLLSFVASAVIDQAFAQSATSSAAASATASYTLQDDYFSGNFFDRFNFYTGYDPTNGHVQYVNRSVATAQNYIGLNSTAATMSVDNVGLYPKGGPGRPSVRIISQANYTHGLFITDIGHMPYGCGTWPAFWTLGPNWPNNGEIGKYKKENDCRTKADLT